MKINNLLFKEELIQKVFNPKRLIKICDSYNIELWDLVKIY